MSKTIKFIGTQERWPELAITGKQSVWMPGAIEEREDTEANALEATGLFERVWGGALTAVSTAAVEKAAGAGASRLLSVGVLEQRAERDGVLEQRLPTDGYTVGSIYEEPVLISGKVLYVSNVAENGFALGNDANSGYSMTLPKLTIASAYAAAVNGDCIVINSSATVYDASFVTVAKSLTILPWSYRGVTVRSTDASFTWYLDASNITIGAIVIDSTITAGGRAGSALRANGTGITNLRLLGTKLIAGSSYGLKFMGACYLSGVETDHTATPTSVNLVDPSAVTGNVVVERCTFGGRFQLAASIQGINFVFRDSVIDHSSSGALNVTGATTALIERSSIRGRLSTTSTGINAYGHATVACRSLVIRDINIQNAASASQQAGGYGIGVGAETAELMGAGFDDVAVYRCNIVHTNHGLFLAYGVKRGRAWGNVVRDSIIGLIQKGVSSGDVIMSGNIVIGGPLTGGALRTKEASKTKHYNNLVIADAQTVASASHFILCNTACEDVEFKNNVLHAPGMTVPSAVFIDPDTTGSKNLAGNVYFGTLGNVFNGLSFATWIANNEPSALNVNPQFRGVNDFRPAAGSPLLGTAAPWLRSDVRDFVGSDIGANKGAFAS
jgi:hypothetical protein